jgi:hypothetical protein
MRKIGAILGITALAAVVFTSLPAAAFGFHLGRFYFTCRLSGTITTAIIWLAGTRRGPGQMTSLAAVATAPPPARATPPSRLIARRALKPMPRRLKIVPV